jgi:hypothetical protein
VHQAVSKTLPKPPKLSHLSCIEYFDHYFLQLPIEEIEYNPTWKFKEKKEEKKKKIRQIIQS